MSEPWREHRSAVVRVDVPAGSTDLVIQLLEVGPDDQDHRLIGRASSSAAACRLLAQWLDAILDAVADP